MQYYNDEQASGLFIPLVPELRQRIKKAAAQSNITEQEYVESILNRVVPSETAYADFKWPCLSSLEIGRTFRPVL